MNQHRTALLLITLVASFAGGAANPAGQTCDDRAPCFRDAGATGTADTDRYTQRITLPTGQMIVVAEGEFEPRSAGTGGYLSAQAFSIDANTIVLRSSVAGLPADADPIAALGKALATD